MADNRGQQTSNLVQRLHEVSVDNISPVYEQTWPHSLLREAADEIKRLEQAVKRLEQAVSDAMGLIKRRDDYIERLEAALREIAEYCNSHKNIRFQIEKIVHRALERRGSI